MKVKNFDFLWQYVEFWANEGPDLPAIRYEDQTITWGEFEEQTNNLAKSFLSMDVKKGDVIATMLPASPEYIFSLIAADKIGAVLCALDIKYKKADLKKFISHLEPKLLIHLNRQRDYNIAQTLQEVEKELNLGHGIQYLMADGDSFQAQLEPRPSLDSALQLAKEDQALDDAMLIVFTGGTTGVPKAALLSKLNVAGMAAVEAEILKKHTGTTDSSNRLKTIVSLPPSHVGGTVEMMGTGITGGMDMIVQDTWSPVRVMETIQAEKIKWVGGVPTMYALMLITPELEQCDLSSLKVAVLSGEKTETDLLEMVQNKICPNLVIGYGSTEAGCEITFTEPGEDIDKIADGFVGFIQPKVDIKIVNNDGTKLPHEETGEVLVKGDYTINSYFKMPEEDQAGFTADGWCKTGDLGYLTNQGGLYIKGRKKHIIRVGSYTVMPTEIEEVATQDPSVGMSAAIGVPDKILGEVVWLVVSPTPGTTFDTDSLIKLCKDQLAKFKVPKKIIIKNDLPLTRIGKVHRVELQNEIINQIKGGKYE